MEKLTKNSFSPPGTNLSGSLANVVKTRQSVYGLKKGISPKPAHGHVCTITGMSVLPVVF